MSRSAVGWLLVAVQVVVFIVLLLLPWRSPSLLSAVVGAAVALAGALVLFAAFRRLGNALTPTPVPIEGAGLRTTGPYRFVRHPIYSGVLLVMLGFLIAVGSAWSWAWGAVILIFFWSKSRWEDRLLHEAYGAQWAAWASTTGALVPRMNRKAP